MTSRVLVRVPTIGAVLALLLGGATASVSAPARAAYASGDRMTASAAHAVASGDTASGDTDARAALNLGSSKSYRINPDKARWNPCAPIPYKVNLGRTTAGALKDVKTAIKMIEKASGLDFAYKGTTSVIPRRGYGMGFGDPPPLVVAWARPGEGKGRSNLLSGRNQYGIGGYASIFEFTPEGKPGKQKIVSGYVVLDVVSNRLPAGFGTHSGGARGGLLLHELAHVVGLEHVNDRTQVMYPLMISRSTLGNGDKAGLKKVGRAAGCLQ